MELGVGEQGAAAQRVVREVRDGIQAERVGAEEGQAVESVIAIVGNPPERRDGGHSVATGIILELGGLRKRILHQRLAAQRVVLEVRRGQERVEDGDDAALGVVDEVDTRLSLPDVPSSVRENVEDHPS